LTFWFCVTIGVLAVSAVAFGLVLAALYLYVRWKYMGYLTRVIGHGRPTMERERPRSMWWGWLW
jgi:hypothetical protein